MAATTGGLASISVSAEGFSTSLDLDVWYPSPISLHLDDTTLSLIEGCDPTGNAASNGDGNTLYQSTQLRVLAGTPSLDVTPLLGTAICGEWPQAMGRSTWSTVRMSQSSSL